MFLVDKYYNNSNYITYHQTIINKIIDSFDTHRQIYSNINEIIKLPNDQLHKIVNDLNYGNWQYSNFMHLIVYGNIGCCKEYLINNLLERIYGKSGIELKEVEYTITGYSNTKTKIMIKQSKHHIIIEPNTNGFDKYLIQDIIQDYAKSELLNILKNRKLFKVVVINKIDNLSYYAQASLRRTMEKYSNKCKFILISDQLSKIIEPLRSRCLLIRVQLPTYEQILETLLYISYKENIDISFIKLKEIIINSDNKINHAIWLLEMYKYNIDYTKNWELIINSIVNNINNFKIINNKKLYYLLKKIREQFYILFITNIPTQMIIRKIMIKLLELNNDLKLKYNIINITSIHEEMLTQGTRHIIHFESYIIKLLYLFNNNK
jgi:replication factor C subunit 3/5